MQLTTVGRWMCAAEYAAMLATGLVQESYSGTTYVVLPPNALAFQRQANLGDLYVEFDVPSDCLRKTGSGWAKIIGPHSLQGRNAARKGLAVPSMPLAENLRHVASKLF
jgi:hypothetical protein